MKSFKSVMCLAALCAVCALAVACGRRNPHGGKLWQTGIPSVDSLLEVADCVDEVGDFDRERVDSLMPVVTRLAAQSGDRAVVMAARGRLAWSSGDFPKAEKYYSAAEAAIDSAKRPYLLARVRLGLSRSLPDDSLERKAALLYKALPEFSYVEDSLRVMQALYDINMIYGYVWDDAVQAACLGAAARYVPDSLPVLRALMQVNVLGLIRSDPDTAAYIRVLDSLRRDVRLAEAVPPLGLMVNTDIYRLRGDSSFLDSARRYERITEEGAPWHPALWLYRTYRLRHFVDTHRKDSARLYARMLDRQLEEETPYAGEMVGELINYSEWSGDTTGAARLRLVQRSLGEACGAYAKGRDMAVGSLDPRLTAFIGETRDVRRDRNQVAIPILVASIIAVMVVASTVAIVTARRRRRREKTFPGAPGEELREKLEDANRNLAAQQLRVIHKENVIQNVLGRLEENGNGEDAEARAQILSTLRNAANGAGEWERFATLFTQVRPGFTRNLTEAYPALTQGELRLACLLSIGLDNKQISRLLSIQPDSVKKARQRLRARLGMHPDQTFDAFFSKY